MACSAPRGPTPSTSPATATARCSTSTGITVDAGGKVLYSVGMEVTTAPGKAHSSRPPATAKRRTRWAAKHLPAFVSLQIGLDQPPGAYTVKVTVTDRAAKASKSLTRTAHEVLLAFGLSAAHHHDRSERPDPRPLPGRRQSLWINFLAVGFGDRRATRNSRTSWSICASSTENGKPTLA